MGRLYFKKYSRAWGFQTRLLLSKPCYLAKVELHLPKYQVHPLRDPVNANFGHTETVLGLDSSTNNDGNGGWDELNFHAGAVVVEEAPDLPHIGVGIGYLSGEGEMDLQKKARFPVRFFLH